MPRPGASHFGEPRIELDKLRDWKNQVVAKLTGGTGQLGRIRKVRYVQGDASIVDPTTFDVRDRRRCRPRVLRARDSRDGFAPEHHPEPRARQPARDGLDQRARAERCPRDIARRGRRLHRPRARYRLRGTGLEGHRCRNDARAAAGRGSRPGGRSREARPDDVRSGAAAHEGHLNGRAGERDHGHVRERQPRSDREQVFDKVLVSIGRRPNSEIPGLEQHEGRSRPEGLHQDGRAPAHRGADALRYRRRRRRADARPQGVARGARHRRGHPRREASSSTPPPSPPLFSPIPSWPGAA